MLLRIESADNNRIKLVRKLQNKKGRDAEGKLVIEGINLVSEAIERGIHPDFIMLSNDYDGEEKLEVLKFDNRITVCEVPAQLFNRLTDADCGVGVIAVIDKKYVEFEGNSLPEEANIIVLDRLQDPGNIGTIIRTAVAAGYSLMIAVKGTADVFSPKVLRATAGMIFDLPIQYVDGAGELRKTLSALGKKIVVTTVDSGKPYREEKLDKGVALVIGNEGNGVSDEVLGLADVRVTIPMRGRVESLNAAVSAAILMYEAVR